MRICANVLLLTLVLLSGPLSNTEGLTALAQSQDTARKELVARAKALELKTPYVAPPGDPLEHDASGFAKVMCSAVFITGLDADFAAENVGFFTGPYEARAKLGKPVVDRANKTVTVTLANGVRRIAKYFGDQGCISLPVGKDSLNFKPVKVKSRKELIAGLKPHYLQYLREDNGDLPEGYVPQAQPSVQKAAMALPVLS